MSILLLATGGTFDKDHNELDGALHFDRTHLPDMLKLARNTVPVRVHTLFLKDSLLFTEDDRQAILNYCLETPEKQIIITHGTDSMSVTASYLAKKVKNKTVILTGAMIPYAFGSSDGLFNLGCAFAFVQTLSKGVYVAMNGTYFSAGTVRKNKDKGIFERVQV